MSVTTQPAELVSSADLAGLIDQVSKLATAAGRGDLVDRLTRSRSRLSGRGMRVVVMGAPGQGASSLARVLEHTPSDRLPGATFMDAPGRPGNQLRVPEPGVADVVLFVSDAGHEYQPAELDALARLRAQGSTVAGVITKIDAFPRWADAQRANRARLQAAGLDNPTVPLLPVSAAMADNGIQRRDESLTVASGVPQLVDFLRDRVGIRVEPQLRDAVLADVRTVCDELGRAWNGELDSLNAAGGGTPAERQARAVAELERRQVNSAAWQIGMNDGVTELMSQVDFDLRERLREVMELADVEVGKSNPMRRWPKFDAWIRGQISEQVQASFQLAREKARTLSNQVAAKMVGSTDGSHQGVPLPKLNMPNPDEAIRQVKGLKPLEATQGGWFARIINSLRGGYSGVLMVGLIVTAVGASGSTSMLQSPWALGAGVLLAVFTLYEDLKNTKERAKGEARMAVSKLMDEANFRIGDELRTELRAMHRSMRDHFTVVNDQRLRQAADAVRTAAEASQNGTGSAGRVTELQNNLAELRQIRVRVTPGR